MSVHKYVTTEWSEAGLERFDCVCCGFTMLSHNRILTVRHGRGTMAKLCDGCVNAIASVADGKEIMSDGTVRGET